MQDKRVALVTGANKGIGLQIAKDLTTHGFSVLVGSRSRENGEEAAKSIGSDARALQLDVRDAASISAAAERVRDEFGRLDVLVNNPPRGHLASRILAGRAYRSRRSCRPIRSSRLRWRMCARSSRPMCSAP